MKDFLASAVALAIFLAFIIGVLNAIEAANCRAKWKDSAFEYRYSLFGGCQIKRRDGAWVPTENVRDMAP